MIDAVMCGEMTAKEYLSQAYRIDQRINAKLEQVMALRALATKATGTLSDMPRSDSPNVCRLEDIIIKIVDSENEINAEIDRLIDLKREMRVVIGAVTQPDYQTLLELRYLCFKTWEQIAVSMGYSMPQPKAFLAAKQKNGKDLVAMQVYEETWKWLAERNCAQLIPAQILEQYAMAISRWIQCEECITEYGFLAKHPTTGNAIPSPYVAMSQSFSKQANTLWYQIYQVVRENCSVEFKGATPHDDMMERLLSARRGG